MGNLFQEETDKMVYFLYIARANISLQCEVPQKRNITLIETAFDARLTNDPQRSANNIGWNRSLADEAVGAKRV